MKNVSKLALSLCMAMAASAQAADPAQSREQTQSTQQTQQRERIYGYELMSPQERSEYHNRMRTMKTVQEREAFRDAHHAQMQERARAQGKTLPDMPPAGMGPGPGMGPGMMGPGSGMGPGGGRR